MWEDPEETNPTGTCQRFCKLGSSDCAESESCVPLEQADLGPSYGLEPVPDFDGVCL